MTLMIFAFVDPLLEAFLSSLKTKPNQTPSFALSPLDSG